MNFGLDVGIYGRLATPENVVELAQLAESAGFESIWLADHVVFPKEVESRYPYSPTGRFPVPLEDPVLEPIATMGVLVGATKRVRIGTAVLVIPYRNPVLLGRMLATYDVFSGGRIVLGAGVGWLAEEFAALDARPFADRGAVTDEYLEVVKRVCAGGEVSFRGKHYQLDTVLSYPPSVQRPHPPILIGGTSKVALRRVVRLGDGWLSVGLALDRIGEHLDWLRAHAREAGRRFEDLALVHKLFISIGEAKTGVDGGREPGTGSKEQILDDLKRVQALGFHDVVVRYLGEDAARQREQVERFAGEIMARV